MSDEKKKEHTAIARGAGKWGDPTVPRTGWRFVREFDHGDCTMVCEMCEYMHIRYEHVMEHDHYPPLGVGCICAGHMSDDMLGATERQRRMENRAKRNLAEAKREVKRQQKEDALRAEQAALRAAAPPPPPPIWLHRWKMTHSGNWATKLTGGWRIIVWCNKSDRWQFMFAHGDEKPIWMKDELDSLEEAKTAALRTFEAIYQTI